MKFIDTKRYISQNFPLLFKCCVALYKVKIEIKTLYRLGPRIIIQRFIDMKDGWKKEIPLQRPLAVSSSYLSLSDMIKDIPDNIEGGHTFYFPPEKVKKSGLRDLLAAYPSGAGIKIIKTPGGMEEKYVARKRGCASYYAFSPSHKELMISHNLFYILGIGPRLYDILVVKFKDGETHVAYIVEHIEGNAPFISVAKKFLEEIKDLEKKSLIKLVNWNGYQDMDFKLPDCNGNLIYETRTNKPKYVDLQNFLVGENYSTFLERIVSESVTDSHFGDKSYLLGKEYLYQEIPGLNFVGKRSTKKRLLMLEQLLSQAECSLERKLVLDIGCNIGIMGALCLQKGALWLHGFDLPNVITRTEKVLLSLGCTRFSLTGLNLDEKTSLSSHIPTFLGDHLEGCVILYLSIRGHIGWIKELSKLPWEFMVYEGHENETKEMAYANIRELSKLKKCSIVAESGMKDGNSQTRYIAIIKAHG